MPISHHERVLNATPPRFAEAGGGPCTLGDRPTTVALACYREARSQRQSVTQRRRNASSYKYRRPPPIASPSLRHPLSSTTRCPHASPKPYLHSQLNFSKVLTFTPNLSHLSKCLPRPPTRSPPPRPPPLPPRLPRRRMPARRLPPLARRRSAPRRARRPTPPTSTRVCFHAIFDNRTRSNVTRSPQAGPP